MRGARTGTPGKDQFVGRRLLRLGCFCALGAMTLTRGQSVSWPRWTRTTIPRSKGRRIGAPDVASCRVSRTRTPADATRRRGAHGRSLPPNLISNVVRRSQRSTLRKKREKRKNGVEAAANLPRRRCSPARERAIVGHQMSGLDTRAANPLPRRALIGARRVAGHVRGHVATGLGTGARPGRDRPPIGERAVWQGRDRARARQDRADGRGRARTTPHQVGAGGAA